MNNGARGTRKIPKLQPRKLRERVTTSRDIILQKDGARAWAAACCLRIVHHACVLGNCETDGRKELISWAQGSLDLWSRNLRTADWREIRDAVQIDPIGLILGILCIPHASVRDRILRSIDGFYYSLLQRGVQPFSPNDEALLEALIPNLNASEPPSKLFAWRQGIRPIYPLREDSPDDMARRALIITGFGTDSVRDLSDVAIAVTEGCAFSSARSADIRGAALSLLTSMLLHGVIRPVGLDAYLVRMMRSDGLVGSFDSSSKGATAWLADTVAFYMALQRARHPAVTLYPSLCSVLVSRTAPRLIDREQIDIRTYESAIGRMWRWIERSLDRFLAVLKDGADDAAIKALVELCLTLYVFQLGRSRDRLPSDPTRDRLQRIEKRLAVLLEWEGLIAFFRANPRSTLGLYIYVLLENIVGRRSPHHDEVIALLRDPFTIGQERSPMRHMDICFLRSLANCSVPPLSDQLSRTLLAKTTNPLLFRSGDLYDVTHIVFYATQFGARSVRFSRRTSRWLSQYLPGLTLGSLAYGDLDLGAELLASLIYTKATCTGVLLRAADALVQGIGPDGSVLGPPSVLKMTNDGFMRSYHTTLVTLIALDAVVTKWNRDGIEQASRYRSRANNDFRLLQRMWVPGLRVRKTRIGAVSATYRARNGDRELVLSKYFPHAMSVRNVVAIACAIQRASAVGNAASLCGKGLFRTSEAMWIARDFQQGQCLWRGLRTSIAAWRTLGRLAAELHSSQAASEELRQHGRVVWPELATIGDAHPFRSEIQYFNRLQSMETTLLHGDLHPGNVVTTVDGSFLIDFDESGLGPREADLAISTVYLPTSRFSAGLDELLRGYEEGRGRWEPKRLSSCLKLAPVLIVERQIRRGEIPPRLHARRRESAISLGNSLHCRSHAVGIG